MNIIKQLKKKFLQPFIPSTEILRRDVSRDIGVMWKNTVAEIEMMKTIAAFNARNEKNICEIFADGGFAKVDGEYRRIDRNKYKGKGRPKKSDYIKSQPLFNKNMETP